MPAVFTHHSFGLKLLQENTIKNKNAFLLGSQGPDPFFFFGQIPWKKREWAKDINNFGKNLHDIDISKPYEKLLNYALKHNEGDLLLDYIKGLFAHYSLDRRCHGYIFSRSGFSSDPEKKKIFSFAHSSFETCIDWLISNEDGTFSYHPEKCLDISDDDLMKISIMWKQSGIETAYATSLLDDSFFISVRDYQAVLRLTNTPHAGSFLLVSLFGKKSNAYWLHYQRMIPKAWRGLDFLNKKHELYPDIATGENLSLSFLDMWKEAKKDYFDSLALINGLVSGETIGEKLHEFVSDMTHTGIKVGEKMSYMKLIWPTDKGSLWPSK